MKLEAQVLERSEELRGKNLELAEMNNYLDSFVHGVRFMATPATCAQFLPGSVDFAIDNRPPGYRMLELMPDGAIQTEVCWLESYAQSVVA